MTPTPTASPSNPYGFGPYLDSLSADWYEDDPLLHELLDRYAPDADRERLIRFGPLAAGRLRALAEVSALPGNAPGLQHRDPYDHRLDSVVLPPSTLEALAIAHGQEGLGAVRGNPFVHYAMVYLLAQNGEAGVACSLACTDGLVRALTAAGGGASGSSPARAALDGVLGSSSADYAHAAQFVTEIQGGSDVPANRVRARPEGDAWRIDGPKWFCSNINADWFLVTAKPAGSDTVGLFLVPAFVGGHRNGYTIERLKDKLGTRELATAEVTFEDARAWAVGDPERGLSLLLRYVLTPSRFACTLFAASALRRAERIITDYARFREAFGRPIERYPLVRQTLDAVASSRREALATCFELLRLWESAEADGYSGQDAIDFRLLLSLAKPVLTRLATDQLHEAMMVLGGNGIEERFSPLPRLHRDAVIMETWEGPHNVLITQAVRDFQRFRVRPQEFLERISRQPQPELAERLELALGPNGEVDPTVAVARLAPSVVRTVAEARVPFH